MNSNCAECAHKGKQIIECADLIERLEAALREIENICVHADSFANPPAVVVETARAALEPKK